MTLTISFLKIDVKQKSSFLFIPLFNQTVSEEVRQWLNKRSLNLFSKNKILTFYIKLFIRKPSLPIVLSSRIRKSSLDDWITKHLITIKKILINNALSA